MSLKAAQLQAFSLYSSGVSIGDTSMSLSSFKSIDGVNLSMTSNFGTIGYMTVEPGSRDREEQISFTGITQNSNGTATLTGIKSVLFLSPYTETSSFTKSHPGGVTVVVTNTSGFYNKFPLKDNNEAITGFWTVPDPVSSTDIANKEWVLSVINGGSVSTNALIVIGTAGETVAAGKVVYLKAADGLWYLASSAAAATTDLVQLGIAQGSGTVGNNISGGVLIRGVDVFQSGLTPGTIYYLSTAGGISSSAGTFERAIGQANTATTLYFDPSFFYIPTGKQKAAFVGNNGTPSSTNKFVTESGLSAAIVTAAKFGGTGADGALSISTGTTTIDVGGAAHFTKNYTSISITGNAVLAFTNPNTMGTYVVLKSQGAVTLTSSSTAITTVGMGSAQSNPGFVLVGTNPGGGVNGPTGTAGAAGLPGVVDSLYPKFIPFIVGGGGGGTGGGATGGRGGGALYIECAGAYNFTTGTITTNGSDGTSGGGTGGGGGGAGSLVVLYGTLTANSGTITKTGGAGSAGTGCGGGGGSFTAGTAGSGAVGGTGGTGFSLVAANTEFF